MNRKEAKQIILSTCGEGWLPMVDEIFDALPGEIEVVDIYQKYGTLRADIEPENDEFEDFLYEIESRSEFICEICGNSGSHYVIDRALEAARCKQHSENGVDLYNLPPD